MTTADYDDGAYDRRRYHHAESARRPIAPLAIGGVIALLLVFFAADALKDDKAAATPQTQSETPAADLATQTPPVSAAPDAAASLAVTGAEVAAAPDPEAVDLEGCTLDVQAVKLGDTGPAVECVQKALTVMGQYTGPVDGNFTEAVAGAATAFQSATGLYVDGIVGRQTAEQLGIWPGDESFITRTPKPAPGAVDLEGFPLSSVASAGDNAPALPPDAGQGTGRRIVYSRLHQRVWAINDQEQIVRSYLVSGSQYNNEVPGKHEVYSRSETTTAWNGQATLPLMVRWLDTERGAIGFHQIPRHRDDGTLYQTEDELGTRLSGGCQRQTAEDAQFMWAFGQIGTTVIVL